MLLTCALSVNGAIRTQPVNLTMTSASIHRRLALYICGFDPRGPAHYHRIYTEQSALQSQVSGHQITVQPRKRTGKLRDHWEVQAKIEGIDTRTQFEFLRWDDLVRSRWYTGHMRYLSLTCAATWRAVCDGSLWRLFKCSLPGFSVAAGPIVILLLLIVGVAVLLALFGLVGFSAIGKSMHSTLPWTLATLLVLIPGTAGLLWVSRFAEQRLHMGWSTRSYWFNSCQGREKTPDVDDRLDQHAEYLLQCLKDPQWDEILLIGHSSGAMMASIVIARAAQLEPQTLQDPRLSLLTLGHCFPILTFQPSAKRLRKESQITAQSLGSRWLDFTAPSDRCCTALVDPTEAARAMDHLDCPSPKILSTRIATLYQPESYAQLRKDHFELHFHYIYASQLPGLYDYFAITAGPQSLAQRFSHQPTVSNWRKFESFGGPFPKLKHAQ